MIPLGVGQGLNPAPSGPVDPDFSYTSLLLHGEGTDGSTTILDTSPFASTITCFGNAQIDTAQSKFGSSAINVDSTTASVTNRIRTPSRASLQLAAADFTLECHARWPVVYAGNFSPVFSSKRDTASNFEHSFLYTDNVLHLYVSANGTNVSDLTASWTPSANTWYHLACVRNGTSVRFFVDGVKVGTDQAIGGTIFQGTSNWNAFSDGGNVARFGGWLDEIRITKGLARYWANFTPPSAPHPDM